MKRLALILLAALLLCGCAAQPDPEVTTIPPETATAPASTGPVGLYDPNSALEAATGGAVRVHPLGTEDTFGMLPMDESFLLFSGSECTTLTKLSGDTLHVDASVTLDCSVYPEDPCTHVSEKGVTYYDAIHCQLVFLDAGLREANRITVPEDIIGSPALSSDRKTLYYCTADALRAIDLETNLDRLLKEMFFPYQAITGLHRDDTILECSVQHNDGSWYALYFSTETGETLWEHTGDITLRTHGDFYFASVYDGAYREIVTGSSHFGPSVLNVPNYTATVEPVLTLNGALEIAEDPASGVTALNFYNLESGAHLYGLELPGETYIWNFYGDCDDNCIWFLQYDRESGTDSLCRWELDKTPVQDETLYLGSRHSLSDPDLEGLARCADTARKLSEKYGVNILVWEDATDTQPWDYTLQPEYQVPLISYSLELIDQALSWYPDGFLMEAASGTASGRLNICLVRSITGTADTGALDNAAGLQFWDDSADAYVCVAMDSAMEQSLYHELFHMIESRVLSTCSAYDSWEALNPEDFTYDYDYIANLYREDYDLTEGDTRAFIDTYSMSFPKEDRARIMEYAMMPGNEYYFESTIMQRKLRQLCLGIREAFHLESSTAAYRWEQYLTEPVHANG